MEALFWTPAYAWVALFNGLLFWFFLRYERGRLGQLAADVSFAVMVAGIIWLLFLYVVIPYIPFVSGIGP